MFTGARVESIDALRAFKAALWKFVDAANVALGDAESELHRTLNWLENEQEMYWRTQVRKRTELVSRAADALRQKRLFRDSSGRSQTALDEERALARAKQMLAEAEQKLQNVRRYRNRLRKEMDAYRGALQRLATTVQHDLPTAAGKLEKMLVQLDEYVAVAPPVDAAPPAEPSFDADQPEEDHGRL